MRPLLLLLLLSLSFPAFAQFAPPLGERPKVAGPRTQVMTIGSAHLSEHSDKWSKAWLDGLLDRLAAWRPQVITVENISGTQCEFFRNRPRTYGEVFDTYCRDAAPFQRSLKMTQADAEAEAEHALETWPSAATPVQRRHQAMLFLAAGNFGSAMVQWLRLPTAERHVGDGLTEDAVKLLTRSGARMNESYDVAAEVAARVGLERIVPVDDHTSDALPIDADPGFGPWQQARFDALRKGKAHAALDAVEAKVHDGDSLLAYFRALNAPHAQDAQIQGDFGGALADPDPKRFGRGYVGWWETRNLRMAANIREAITLHPGARVLNLVGASHKPWYDQWARQMSDVDVVDAQTVLGR